MLSQYQIRHSTGACIDPSSDDYKDIANSDPREGLKAIVSEQGNRTKLECKIHGEVLGIYETDANDQNNPLKYTSHARMLTLIRRGFISSSEIGVEVNGKLKDNRWLYGSVARKYCNVIAAIANHDIQIHAVSLSFGG